MTFNMMRNGLFSWLELRRRHAEQNAGCVNEGFS